MAAASQARIPERRVQPGVSLARGPALAVGVILLGTGLYFLYRQHIFPPFSNFPSGRAPVTGHAIVGVFGINGWTGMLTAVAGGLLLIGAAEHFMAKTMSLIVGAALAAAAIIGAVSGDVLGLMAANGWTEVGWGVAAVILLFNAAAPRRRQAVDEPAAPEPALAARRRPVVERETAVPRRQAGGPAGDPESGGPAAASPTPTSATRVTEPGGPAAASTTPTPATGVTEPGGPPADPATQTPVTGVREPADPLERPLEPPDLGPEDETRPLGLEEARPLEDPRRPPPRSAA